MKKYILIQNDGEIETNSFELIGASTKRNDSTKIGFFGSGLKYSIAFMMRNKIDFKVYSGMQELVFTTKDETLKDQVFKRICINGVSTSYTTTMGPTWEMQWFVLREIYCNAVDEGSCQLIKSTYNVEPSEGRTRIYIELTSTLQSVIDNWDAYFSDEREPLFTADNPYTGYLNGVVSHQPIKVYSKTEGSLFRKGVKVGGNDQYIYDYECTNVDINEDRTAKHLTALSYGITSMMFGFYDENYILTVLREEGSYENSCLRMTNVYGKHGTGWVKFSNDYLLVVKEVSGKYAEKINESPKECLFIPEHFARELKKTMPDIKILGMGKVIGNLSMEVIEATPKMNFLLKEVTLSLKEMGYEIPYDILIAEFQEDNILGNADIPNKKIYIADKTFDMGRRELAMTLMEECEHIRSGAEDETRKFQNHIFSKWLSYMEDKNALFL